MLVLGAGSGVGLAAVDIGSALGLRVIAAASTPEKRALAESRGAMATIDNSTLDAAGIKDAAKAFAATFDDRADRGGVDLVYDPVGGEVGEVALRALGEDGQYLVIGFVAGIPKLPANQVLLAQSPCHRGRLGGVGRPQRRRQSGTARRGCRTDRRRRPRPGRARRLSAARGGSCPSRPRRPQGRRQGRARPARPDTLRRLGGNRWWRSWSDLADCAPTWWS
jgi:NADPH:quinone reductase-like Zn-dependent oxidoreductase